MKSDHQFLLGITYIIHIVASRSFVPTSATLRRQLTLLPPLLAFAAERNETPSGGGAEQHEQEPAELGD